MRESEKQNTKMLNDQMLFICILRVAKQTREQNERKYWNERISITITYAHGKPKFNWSKMFRFFSSRYHGKSGIVERLREKQIRMKLNINVLEHISRSLA